MSDEPDEGWFPLDVATADAVVLVAEATTFELDNAIFSWRKAGFDVRSLRGGMMRSLSAAYNEIAAVFQFPLYFGQNLMAVDDLFTDLEWIPPSRGWVIPISEPELFLIDDSERDYDFLLFVQVLMGAKAYWAGSTRYDSSTAAPHLPFNILLAASSQPSSVASMWRGAGVDVRRSRTLPQP